MRLCYSRRVFVMAFPTHKSGVFRVRAYARVRALRRGPSAHQLPEPRHCGQAGPRHWADGAWPQGIHGRPEIPAGPSARTAPLVCCFAQPVPVRVASLHTVGGAREGRRGTWSGLCAPQLLGAPSRCGLLVASLWPPFEELNLSLLQACQRDDHRRVAREPTTTGAAWEEERRSLRPLPPFACDCCAVTTVRLTPCGTRSQIKGHCGPVADAHGTARMGQLVGAIPNEAGFRRRKRTRHGIFGPITRPWKSHTIGSPMSAKS